MTNLESGDKMNPNCKRSETDNIGDLIDCVQSEM